MAGDYPPYVRCEMRTSWDGYSERYWINDREVSGQEFRRVDEANRGQLAFTPTTTLHFGTASSFDAVAAPVAKKHKPLWLLETERKIARRFGIAAR